MIAVIFEVELAPGCEQDYLGIAGELRGELESADGFVSIERFSSLSQPGKILSLSFWRDEAAVQAWRTRDSHRAAQARGRNALFAGYRLRVANVLRDYGMNDRAQAPQDSRAIHG